jgi:hypothetical protein
MLNTGVSLQRLATKAGVGFTPKKLFSNGEAGVWYDPSDVEASLTWRRNLLEYTESFDNSYWSESFVTVDSDFATSPNGSQTAEKVTETTGNGQHLVYKSGVTQTGNKVFSVYVKQGSGSRLLRMIDYNATDGGQGETYFNITNGTVAQGSGIIESTGNGWYRCSITSTTTVSSQYYISMGKEVSAGNYAYVYTGDGSSNFYIWGAQLEEGSTATEYQPIRSTFNNAFKQAFPKHTLYQNEYGKTPVTGFGQAVGLMLDKSQGVAFGDEEVTNGGFDSASNWTIYSADAASNISNGVAYVESAGSNAYMIQQLTGITAGKTYVIKFNYINGQGTGLAYVRYAGTDLAPSGVHEVGEVSYIFTAGSGSQELRFMTYATDGASFTIDDVSVKEVSGSHATQSDSTKRPVYARHPERGRVNLFKYTEELDNSYYDHLNGLTVTPNAGVAPDGSQTADRLTFANNNLSRLEKAFPNGQANTPVVYSVWMRTESGSVSLDLGHEGSGKTNVTVTTEWQRFTHTFTDTDGSFYPRVQNNEAVTKNVLSWGWQIEYANEATGYQKVVDDYDITESGYKSVYYLQFDGVNDTMTVQPVTSTIAPISVFMGHDTEGNSSTSGYFLDIESGRFLLAGAGYYSTASSWQNGTNIDATAKGVSTVVSDGTNANYRRDGIVERTGALANVPIEGEIAIFSRYDYTTQLTNGNMYQLVIRGATSTDKEIDQAEEFVAIKTGLKSEVVGLATLDLNFGANTYTARNSNGSVL